MENFPLPRGYSACVCAHAYACVYTLVSVNQPSRGYIPNEEENLMADKIKHLSITYTMTKIVGIVTKWAFARK